MGVSVSALRLVEPPDDVSDDEAEDAAEDAAEEEAVSSVVVLPPPAALEDEELLLQATAARLRPMASASVRPVRLLKRAVMRQSLPFDTCAGLKWRCAAIARRV